MERLFLVGVENNVEGNVNITRDITNERMLSIGAQFSPNFSHCCFIYFTLIVPGELHYEILECSV